jgi:hypothetical protein
LGNPVREGRVADVAGFVGPLIEGAARLTLGAGEGRGQDENGSGDAVRAGGHGERFFGRRPRSSRKGRSPGPQSSRRGADPPDPALYRSDGEGSMDFVTRLQSALAAAGPDAELAREAIAFREEDEALKAEQQEREREAVGRRP